MSDQTDLHSTPRVPPHVPAHLVRDMDFYQIPVGEDPQRDYADRFRNEPDIFYITHTAKDPQWGNWVVTCRKDIQAIMQDPETFSSQRISGFDRALGGGGMVRLSSGGGPSGAYQVPFAAQSSVFTSPGEDTGIAHA